ncbi:MAG: cellulase family glycosylhydrolase [Solirubrobacteraceae bacterium]|nr:cellulase family glycosylhydrolase [Solirubrobacteraceae bacterium]
MLRALLVLTAALLGLAPLAHAAPHLPLSSEGRWIVDADGRTVILHGENRVAKRPPYAPDADGFSAEDAAFLAREGDNAVRLGVIWTAVEPRPGRYDDAYLDRIERTVRELHAEGIVSLLDFHQDMVNERFEGQGFPSWAVFPTGGLPNPKLGFPTNQLLSPALMSQYDRLLRNSALPDGSRIQDRYAEAWRHVAARFRDVPGVAGYDLINEPWPGSTWLGCIVPDGCPREDRLLHAFQTRVTARIRTVDADTLVWFEPFSTFNAYARTRMPALPPKTVFSFHTYCPGEGVTLQYTPGCDGSDSTVMRRAESYAGGLSRAPAVLTEFGATDDVRVLERIVALADRHRFGWMHWAFTGGDPTTQAEGDTQAIVIDDHLPPTRANVKTRKLDVLSRPYPRVVAGTPTAWSFDRRSGRFAATWSTTGPDGTRFGPDAQTEIALPARQFPHGAHVTVDGGDVVSPPGAAVLRVTAHPGAGAVSVRARRASG